MKKVQSEELKEILINLKEEICNLKVKINRLEKEKKIRFNTKEKVKLLSKLSIPYIITSGIVLAFFKYTIGSTPFIKDNNKLYLDYKKEIDSLGNIKTEECYRNYLSLSNNDNVFYVCHKWSKDHDKYIRIVDKYKMKLTETEIREILNDKEIDADKLFGDKLTSYVERRTYVNSEELYKDVIYKGIIYDYNKNIVKYVEESNKDNFVYTVFYLVLSGAINALTFILHDPIRKYKRVVNDECYDYNSNIKELKKLLKVKEDNYNRLTR